MRELKLESIKNLLNQNNNRDRLDLMPPPEKRSSRSEDLLCIMPGVVLFFSFSSFQYEKQIKRNINTTEWEK
jgi:hypothetical protein